MSLDSSAGAAAALSSSEPDSDGMFSSTLAAGVRGGSAPRFMGTTGGTMGDRDGKATTDDDGVDSGVAIVELVNGTEW